MNLDELKKRAQKIMSADYETRDYEKALERHRESLRQYEANKTTLLSKYNYTQMYTALASPGESLRRVILEALDGRATLRVLYQDPANLQYVATIAGPPTSEDGDELVTTFTITTRILEEPEWAKFVELSVRSALLTLEHCYQDY